MICFRGETGVCGVSGSTLPLLVNFLTYCFETSPPLLSPQLSVSDKKYRVAGGMMRLSPTPLRDQADLQGPSHLSSLQLTVIYRDRVKWVCSAVVHLQGPCHLSFFWKMAKKCTALY